MTDQEVIASRMGFMDLVRSINDEPNPILALFNGYSNEIIHLAFGKIGQRIMNFLGDIDQQHPDSQDIINNLFPNSYKQEELHEFLDLAKYAYFNKLTKIYWIFSNSTVLAESNFKYIDSPKVNKSKIRLLKDRKVRDKLRLERPIQPIDISVISRKGMELWGFLPDKFNSFFRFNVPYQDEICEIIKKITKYKSLGCTDIAERLYECYEVYKNADDNYFGFNRLTIADAALVSAKWLGFNLRTSYFEATTHSIVAHINESSVCFEPRLYPFGKFAQPDENTIKIVEHIESFPGACGKPIFDHYIVVVPGLEVKKNRLGLYEVDDITYTNKEEAAQALDVSLLNEGKINPIILGERDGKCYFISFWK